MVNPRVARPFIDREIPDSQDARKLLVPSRQDSTAVWVGQEGPETGRVAYGDGSVEQVAPITFGVYPDVPGAIVPVEIGPDGRVSRIYPPTTLTPDVPVIGVGDAGKKILTSATSEYVDAELAEARTELESAKTELEGAITAANEDIAEVAGVATTANAAAEAAQATADTARQEAEAKAKAAETAAKAYAAAQAEAERLAAIAAASDDASAKAAAAQAAAEAAAALDASAKADAAQAAAEAAAQAALNVAQAAQEAAEQGIRDASTASQEAATAHTLASSKSRVTTGPTYPTNPSVGDLHWLTETQGNAEVVVGLKIRGETSWLDYKMYVDSIAAVNSISAEKIVASESLSAKAGQFAQAFFDEAVARNIRVTNELITDTLIGKTVYGAHIEGGEILMQGEDPGQALTGVYTNFSTAGEENPWGSNPLTSDGISRVSGGKSGYCLRSRASVRENADGTYYLQNYVTTRLLSPLSDWNFDAVPYEGVTTMSIWVKTTVKDTLSILGPWFVNALGDSALNVHTVDVPANVWTEIKISGPSGYRPQRNDINLLLSSLSISGEKRPATAGATTDIFVDEITWSNVPDTASSVRIFRDAAGTPSIQVVDYQGVPRIQINSPSGDAPRIELSSLLASLRLTLDSSQIPAMSMDGPSGNEQVRVGRFGEYYGLRLSDLAGNMRAQLLGDGPEVGLFIYQGGVWRTRIADYGIELRRTSGAVGLELASGFAKIDYSRTQSGTGGLYLVGSGSFDSTAAANLVRDGATGRVAARSSLRALKHDIQEIQDDPKRILDIPIVSWIDRGQQERSWAYRQQQAEIAYGCHVDERDLIPDPGPLRRIPGVIAEDVEAAGLELLTERNRDGSLQSVAYERWAMYNTLVEREHEREIRELRSQIRALTERVERLEAANAENTME